MWLEVVTLLVPGFNDSEAELRHRRVPRFRQPRHSVARHRVSSGLQDDRPPRHDCPRNSSARRKSAPKRGCILSMPAMCPAAWSVGEHILSRSAAQRSLNAPATWCGDTGSPARANVRNAGGHSRRLAGAGGEARWPTGYGLVHAPARGGEIGLNPVGYGGASSIQPVRSDPPRSRAGFIPLMRTNCAA